MAKKITDYAPAAVFDGSELFEVVQGAVNKKGVLGAVFPPGYLDGLQLIWISGAAITVTTGAAHIPGLARVVRASADIAKTGIGLAASTWYHVYLYMNGAVLDVEVVTTAPSAPYNGNARTKAGDTSRRYLGSVKTGSASTIISFTHVPATGQMIYKTPGGSFRPLSAGAATTSTTIDCGAFVPVTANALTAKFQNQSSPTTPVFFADGDQTVTSSAYFIRIAGATEFSAFVACPVNSAQQIAYVNSAAGGAAYVDVSGYFFQR